ncbi:hypothetical protein [Paenibacillus terrigena]|uniref:hypothetical protein n=1 Tax=Paenibacillus terrigena TaxID=369333 RepID=UPI0012EC94DB|nr:hypothetical protein [Paenibacillus terrigena]
MCKIRCRRFSSRRDEVRRTGRHDTVVADGVIEEEGQVRQVRAWLFSLFGRSGGQRCSNESYGRYLSKYGVIFTLTNSSGVIVLRTDNFV